MAKLVLNLSANEIQDKLIKEILSKYLEVFFTLFIMPENYNGTKINV